MRRFQTWESAIASFLKDLELGRTKRTIQTIRTRLRNVPSVSESPSTLTRRKYMTWIENIRDKRQPSYAHSVNNNFMRLLRYIRHPLEPKLMLYRIKIPEEPIAVYTDQEIDTICQWCIRKHDDPKARRAAVYLLIAMTSALRTSEICSLEWKYWDIEKRRFRVMKTKTHVAGWAKVAEFAAPIIEEWRDEVGGRWVMPSLSLSFNPVHPRTMRHYLSSTVSKELGIEELTTKKFRATVAKLVYESSRSLETTASILRHKTIETTRKFYHRIEMDRVSDAAHDEAFAGLNTKLSLIEYEEKMEVKIHD